MTSIAALTGKEQVLPVVSEPVITWTSERTGTGLSYSSLGTKMLDVAAADVQRLCLTERAFAVLHCNEPLFDARMSVDCPIEIQTR